VKKPEIKFEGSQLNANAQYSSKTHLLDISFLLQAAWQAQDQCSVEKTPDLDDVVRRGLGF